MEDSGEVNHKIRGFKEMVGICLTSNHPLALIGNHALKFDIVYFLKFITQYWVTSVHNYRTNVCLLYLTENFILPFCTRIPSERVCKVAQSKMKQDMTVPFARARAKLGGSIR